MNGDEIKFTSVEFSNNAFSFDHYGAEEWYPWGSYTINFKLFDKTPRWKANRVVWIWIGKEGVGKSFLSSKLRDLTVYETDVSSTLPEVIYADVIIIGNKYPFTVEDVKRRVFGDAEINIVSITH